MNKLIAYCALILFLVNCKRETCDPNWVKDIYSKREDLIPILSRFEMWSRGGKKHYWLYTYNNERYTWVCSNDTAFPVFNKETWNNYPPKRMDSLIYQLNLYMANLKIREVIHPQNNPYSKSFKVLSSDLFHLIEVCDTNNTKEDCKIESGFEPLENGSNWYYLSGKKVMEHLGSD